MSEIDTSGEITVEGHVVGRLKGLSFEPVSTAGTLEGKAVRGAAVQALKPILIQRLNAITTSDDLAFQLSDAGAILYNNEPIARLAHGGDWLSPRVELIGGGEADDNSRTAAQTRLQSWIEAEIARKLPSHHGLKVGEAAKTLEGLARGLAFRIMETGAAIDLREATLKLSQANIALAHRLGQPRGRIDWQLSTQLITQITLRDESDAIAHGLRARPEIQADRWQLVGRTYRDSDLNRSVENYFGVQYESCCWAIQIVAQRQLSNRYAADGAQSVDEFDSGISMQFIFKGMGSGSTGNNMLSNGLFGYRQPYSLN